MNPSYTGEERRKAPLLELLGKRITLLELNLDRQSEVTEVVVSHLKGEIHKLEKDIIKVQDICRSCVCFQDDFK